MKTTWEIENGALKITVKDGKREQTFTFRKSHTPQVLADGFATIAEVLGLNVAECALPHALPTALDKLMNAKPVAYVGAATGGIPVPLEPPERAELRRQAEAAKANAEWAHATNDEDTMAAIGSKLPEFKAAGDTTGFSVLPPPSAAIDGTVYDNTQYRKDKSNWVKE